MRGIQSVNGGSAHLTLSRPLIYGDEDALSVDVMGHEQSTLMNCRRADSDISTGDRLGSMS